MKEILIYGANGFVGKEISKIARKNGLKPILGGRNEGQIKEIASELELDHAVVSLDDPHGLHEITKRCDIVLNCAGPFMKTFEPLVKACIEHKAHYLDITGEIPVFQAIHKMDAEAKKQNVMLLPGIGFDVAPTDCLALYLKEKMPTGDRLTLAFYSKGPAGIPPGTMKTMISLLPFGHWIRKDGELIHPGKGLKSKMIDFNGQQKSAYRLNWGDVFTAYHSTRIPNIEVYAAFPKSIVTGMRFIELLRPLLTLPLVMNFLQKNVKGGSTHAQREQTHVWVYGELSDPSGRTAIGRMNGPEAGVNWTSLCAIQAIKKIVEGDFRPGYQTPASAFGANFVSAIDGVEMGEIEFI